MPHKASVYFSAYSGGRSTCNLELVNDIDLKGGSNRELQDLINRHISRATAYGMGVLSNLP